MNLLCLAVTTTFPVDAVHFHCSFYFSSYSFLGQVYVCKPNVTLTESTMLEKVTGDHLSQYTNEDVRSLLITDQDLPFFPEGITAAFVNLKILSYDKANLLSINAQDLMQFPQLELLILNGNNLPYLESELFMYTPLLRLLYLDNDQIQHIGEGLLDNFVQLQQFSIGWNPCIHKFAFSRAEVIEIAPQLSVLCPPPISTTTVETTKTTYGTTTTTLDATTFTYGTTTDQTDKPCQCTKEVEILRDENLQQNLKIEQLQNSNDQLTQTVEKLFDLNAAVDKKLLEIEMELREISSAPCSN